MSTPRTDAARLAANSTALLLENVILIAETLERENAALRETLAEFHDGRSVVLPKTEKHARMMLIVAEACFPSSPGDGSTHPESRRVEVTTVGTRRVETISPK